MLEVELDILSGMPNPKWLLSRSEEAELMERLAAEPEQVSPAATPEEAFGLGYRGLLVRLVKPDEDSPFSSARGDALRSLPDEFRVGHKSGAREPIGDWLLETSVASGRETALIAQLREAAAGGVILQAGSSAISPSTFTPPAADSAVDTDTGHLPSIPGEGADSPGRASSSPEAGPPSAAPWWDCASNYFWANADTFNAPEHVTRNNCYCFASNHLAGVRYARPGRRGGRPATSMSCGAVTDGLVADGWQEGCQENGLTIVMVIWPGVDYHFYRLVTDGPYWWWGHKPGGTPAKYTDDCGHSIYQYNGQGYAPNNICRGSYTDFCGYFYQNNWTAFVA